VESIGDVIKENDASYLLAFFTRTTNGIDSFNETANFKVTDGASTWEFSNEYTTQVTALVNAPAEMAGEDIEVTKLADVFRVDEDNGYNLITRRLSRGVVADCFALSKRRSNHAIVGSPGIGKSWTLLYALQQALLYNNACVVIWFQKDGKAYTCIRRNNAIFVWQQGGAMLQSTCYSEIFQNSKVLLLLDPRESKSGGAAFAQG
jgi:hypothetical protein